VNELQQIRSELLSAFAMAVLAVGATEVVFSFVAAVVAKVAAIAPEQPSALLRRSSAVLTH
jgi:hypothetical protein